MSQSKRCMLLCFIFNLLYYLQLLNIPKNLISDVQMHDVPVVLLIVLTNTVADILMRQFGHANGDKMGSEHWVFGNAAPSFKSPKCVLYTNRQVNYH